MSRIRGGHNFITIRFSDQPISSHSDSLTLIIALNYDTANLHFEELDKIGKIIAVDEWEKINSEYAPKVINLPTKEIIQKTGNRRVVGTAALGCAIKLFGLPLSSLMKEIEIFFEGQVLDANKISAQEGYDSIETLFDILLPKQWENIFINGNESVALGALAAGCKFYAGYPMTPATSIMTYLAKKSNEARVIVEQAEDEIAAINMALGASSAGLRAMTGSSGGGFALMVEGVSLAGIAEIPIVIAVAQRPGPATGFPTRTEQGDLGFVIHSGHGEFPRMVMALRHPEDAFYQTARAFNIAEKYQIPVFLLTDQYLADYTTTIKPFDFSQIKIERYLANECTNGIYSRYALTDSGLSPRIVPGKIPGVLVNVDSDEHDESGHITESAEIRYAMVNKRLRKIDHLHDELIEPEYVGCEEPEILLLCWGSTYGPVKEAILNLNLKNHSIGALIFGDIYPLPTKSLNRLVKTTRKVINLEQNSTGQLAALIKQQTMIACDHSLLKYDGRQWSKDVIIDTLTKEVL